MSRVRLWAFVLATAALGRSAFADSVAASTQTASASQSSWSGSGWKHLQDIWELGGYELYAPVYTYHMPYAYTQELLRSYNDFPVGGGLGKGRYNERGNYEGLFALEFADSHSKPEYEGGYAWIATWHPFASDFRAGAGMIGFITARSDIRRYTPFPGVLPIASMGWWKLDVQATFIPGGKNNGNVLFSWVKLSFY